MKRIKMREDQTVQLLKKCYAVVISDQVSLSTPCKQSFRTALTSASLHSPGMQIAPYFGPSEDSNLPVISDRQIWIFPVGFKRLF